MMVNLSFEYNLMRLFLGKCSNYFMEIYGLQAIYKPDTVQL